MDKPYDRPLKHNKPAEKAKNHDDTGGTPKCDLATQVVRENRVRRESGEHEKQVLPQIMTEKDGYFLAGEQKIKW